MFSFFKDHEIHFIFAHTHTRTHTHTHAHTRTHTHARHYRWSEEKRLAIYEAFRKEHSWALLPRVLPLRFVTGALLEKLLTQYLKDNMRKGKAALRVVCVCVCVCVCVWINFFQLL